MIISGKECSTCPMPCSEFPKDFKYQHQKMKISVIIIPVFCIVIIIKSVGAFSAMEVLTVSLLQLKGKDGGLETSSPNDDEP